MSTQEQNPGCKLILAAQVTDEQVGKDYDIFTCRDRRCPYGLSQN